MGFPCRHIVRTAVTYPELLLLNLFLRRILGTRITLESLFDLYWKHTTDESKHLYVAAFRQQMAFNQPKNMPTES